MIVFSIFFLTVKIGKEFGQIVKAIEQKEEMSSKHLGTKIATKIKTTTRGKQT